MSWVTTFFIVICGPGSTCIYKYTGIAKFQRWMDGHRGVLIKKTTSLQRLCKSYRHFSNKRFEGTFKKIAAPHSGPGVYPAWCAG
ncbi:hypothetical protein CPB84DRAFT_1433187 [Gymnopilus junonius]|uniref:Uncharacterized protein n=1 Tax=Gymnopilus junonius TaxID=109634 RepID=A0A9P5NYE0_GYMJU|nr:hypothetical protein CPB84DRAFT_1433187 [Gymnopilus junonius]